MPIIAIGAFLFFLTCTISTIYIVVYFATMAYNRSTYGVDRKPDNPSPAHNYQAALRVWREARETEEEAAVMLK